MYKATIGIEVHAFLTSDLKVFSNSKNSYSDTPNIFVNERDLGMPGTLPKLNKDVIDMALAAALALNCNINKVMHFDRKNYFYPDLPKGYQITQNKTPIGFDGYVEIEVSGETKKIRIERIHIEEDTAKSKHVGDSTYLNFNRAGCPLVEIVTKPDIKSEKEAMQYVKELRNILLYLGISDVKMEEGSLRCDANVSLSKDEVLGNKVEVKNIGSITNVGNAISYEIKRQQEILESNGTVIEETRRFDDVNKKTISMRVKEKNNDYRYFPEPDIPFVHITDEEIDKIKEKMPMLPKEMKTLFSKKGINPKNIEALLLNKELAFVMLNLGDCVNFVKASNILTGDVSGYLNEKSISLEKTNFDISRFEKIVELVDNNTISSKHVKDIIPVFLEKVDDINKIMDDLSIKQISDEDSVLKIIKEVLNKNEGAIKDYKDGKDKAFKYLMGQVMKETKGQVNPGLASKLLSQELKKQ